MPSSRNSFHRSAVLALAALICTLALPRAVRAEEPSTLLGTLWAQTSAEYRALCRQTYAVATYALSERARLANYSRDAQGRLQAEAWIRSVPDRVRPERRPVAVVMDLDETVLDNSAYEVWLLRSGGSFTPRSWAAFVHFEAMHADAQRSVPGAVDFIRAVERLGISVVYLTDRDSSGGGREDTARLLAAVGVGTDRLDERLLMNEGREADRAAALRLLHDMGVGEDSPEGRAMLANQSKKGYRRFQAMLRWHVVGWFGDNVNDFPIYFPKSTPAGRDFVALRREEVDRNAAHWGADWFVLPNPVYGSWAPGAALPKDRLLEQLDDRGFGETMRGAQ